MMNPFSQGDWRFFVAGPGATTPKEHQLHESRGSGRLAEDGKEDPQHQHTQRAQGIAHDLMEKNQYLDPQIALLAMDPQMTLLMGSHRIILSQVQRPTVPKNSAELFLVFFFGAPENSM